jgi:hypothetical protein
MLNAVGDRHGGAHDAASEKHRSLDLAYSIHHRRIPHLKTRKAHLSPKDGLNSFKFIKIIS